MRTDRSIRWIALALAVVLIPIAYLTHRGTEGTRSVKYPDGVPLQYLPSVSTVTKLSLGHRPALADWYWIRAKLYYAAEARASETHAEDRFEWLRQYTDVVVTLDPNFQEIYRWAGGVLIFRGREVTFEDVQEANAYLEAGAERFPNDWRMPMSAMANCSFYYYGQTPEERAWLEACRKKFGRMGMFRPGAPASFTLLAAQTLAEEGEGGGTPLCSMLFDIYTFSQQEDVREQIRRQLKSGVCGQQTPQELAAMQGRFDDLHERTYPYLSPDLLVHVVDTERLNVDGALDAEEDESP